MKKIPHDMVSGTIHETANYGFIEIIEYHGCFNVSLKFVDTGWITHARSEHIRNGQVMDALKPTVYGVGYLGDGIHKTKSGKHHTKAYSKWYGMMERCYSSKYHSLKPTYKDCTVCEDWRNFQNFARWHNDNHPKDGKEYHLDKDIKIKGNKVYSPDTCLFVSPYENNVMAQAKSYIVTSPKGEIFKVYNMAEFCRKNNLIHGGMSKAARGERSNYKGWLVNYSPTL